MKCLKYIFLTITLPILIEFIPIVWDIFESENRELTICEERRIDLYNTLGNVFLICTKDCLILNNYRIIEYSITNSGNKTIVGTGIHSDLLIESNGLSIASDSVLINLCRNDASIDLVDNHIRFKQIKPGEKIILLCASRLDEDGPLIHISDRDIKDTDIIYTKRNNKLTTFEKTTSTNRWISVVGFMFNLIIVLIFVIMSFLDVAKQLEKWKIVFLFLSFLCLIYTLLLPVRWLL